MRLPVVRSTNDATILQFDFVPTGSEISFQYVHGSDEVLGGWADPFGFFVNGTNYALPARRRNSTGQNLGEAANSAYVK